MAAVAERAESSIGSGAARSDHLHLPYTRPQARVVEWQTQQTQNLPLARACEFDSRPGHHVGSLYDLDMDPMSLVKALPSGRHGTVYPDMPWEPKASFAVVPRYFAGS